jgi:hypothetical protein
MAQELTITIRRAQNASEPDVTLNSDELEIRNGAQIPVRVSVEEPIRGTDFPFDFHAVEIHVPGNRRRGVLPQDTAYFEAGGHTLRIRGGLQKGARHGYRVYAHFVGSDRTVECRSQPTMIVH